MAVESRLRFILLETDLRLVNLKGDLFFKAEAFLLPRETECCALMELVLNRNENIFAFLQDTEICGIFSCSKTGLLLCDLPFQTNDIFLLLKRYFSDKKVRVVFGESSSVRFVTRSYAETTKNVPLSIRNCVFMRFDSVFNTGFKGKKANFSLQQNILSQFQVKICSVEMENQLAKYYFSYLEEEVLVKGKSINRAAERLNLHKALERGQVWALFSPNATFCAMAHIRSVGKNARLLGGIYTAPPLRNRGFASALLYAISDYFNKTACVTTLYVDKQNAPAIACYKASGFTFGRKCQVVYF